MLNIKIKKYSELTEELEKIWENSNNSNYFFQSLAYIKTYLGLKKNDKNINRIFLLVICNNEPIYILPLEVYSIFSFKVVRWIGNDYFDFCGPIIVKNTKIEINKENFMEIINKAKEELGIFDFIFFNNQPEFIDDIVNPFVKFLDNKFYSSNFFILLEKNIEIYYKKLKETHNNFKRFNRYKKKLLNNYNVNFQNVSFNDKEISISKIIKAKINNLNKEKKKHNLDFFAEKINNEISLNYKKNFLISYFKINDELAHACISYIYKNNFYYYITTDINNNFRNYPIGKIFISYLIEWCQKNNIKKFDFCLGEEEYKKFFSNSNQNVSKYFYSNNLKGAIIVSIIKLFLIFKYLRIKK